MLIRTEKVRFFRRHLLDFFRKSGRSELPWRREGITAYEVWVSEVMLQQTQVSRVIDYYNRFLMRFPTVEKLSQANWETFLPYYEGLGYYARGRNMLKTAQAVVREHRGKFPVTVAELEILPGIGPYTARAIASFAYDASELAWDTNLKRVIGRFFLGAKDRIGEQEMPVFNAKLGRGARALNAALMDFGSAICTARPKCTNCPLRNECRYFREKGRQESRMKHQASRGGRRLKQSEVIQTIVFLHEHHKQYFSSTKKQYQPFLLPSGYTTRAAIKDYFQAEHGLALAVRPPHKTVHYRSKATQLIHAQILLGSHQFIPFPKSAVLEYTEREKLDT